MSNQGILTKSKVLRSALPSQQTRDEMNAFNRAVWEESPLMLTVAQTKELSGELLRVFSTIFDKWEAEKGYFTLSIVKQIVDEIFAGMEISFEVSADDYETIKRRAVTTLNLSIISEFNDPFFHKSNTKHQFIAYYAGLFGIWLRSYNFPKGSRGTFKPVTR